MGKLRPLLAPQRRGTAMAVATQGGGSRSVLPAAFGGRRAVVIAVAAREQAGVGRAPLDVVGPRRDLTAEGQNTYATEDLSRL